MPHSSPQVGIVMGSLSDYETVKSAEEALTKFGIQYETKVVSAHRTPRDLADYGGEAAKRGLKVIIAAAGGAAHLPGMMASYTTLPVIGVPVQTATLSGVDSLYSIVQMPKGVPVATVGIGSAENAGILAARILGAFDEVIAKRLVDYAEELEFKVAEMNRILESKRD